MLEQKIAPLPHGQNGLTIEERRRVPRHPSDLETSCQPIGARDGTKWRGQVRDISRFGIGLVLERRFERGAVLSVDLENPAQGLCRNVLARVIHATAQDDGRWLLGCALTSELADEDMEPFSIQRVEPAEPDVRAWVRFACDQAMVCRRAGDKTSNPWQGKIANVSPGGVGILIPWPVETGSFLSIELVGLAGPPRVFLVRVVQPARREGASWLLGCEFTQAFEDAELNELLGESFSQEE